jgi:hypothetical protein
VVAGFTMMANAGDWCRANLVSLEEQVADLRVKRLEPSTRASYSKAVRDYVNIAEALGLEPWPAKIRALEASVLFWSQRVAVGSVRKYISAVKAASEDVAGFFVAQDVKERLRLLIAGTEKIDSGRVQRQASAIPWSQVMQAARATNLPLQLEFSRRLLVMTAGSLSRVGDLFSLSHEFISASSAGYESFTVELARQTKQSRKSGVRVVKKISCLVAAWTEERNCPKWPICPAHLFWMAKMSKAACGADVFHLQRHQVNSCLQALFKHLKLPTKEAPTGHSLRRSAAQRLAETGNETVARLAGEWALEGSDILSSYAKDAGRMSPVLLFDNVCL